MAYRGLCTGLAALLLALAPAAAATAAPDARQLSASNVHVPAATLAVDRDGRAVAAIWSEYRRGRADLVMARIGDDRVPGGRHVLLHSTLPVRTLGAAASADGHVAIVAARSTNSRRDSILGVLVAPGAKPRVARLARGNLAGHPPAVAVGRGGAAAAAWRDGSGLHVVRAARGAWTRVRDLGSGSGAPAVAVGDDGSAALLVRRGSRIELRRGAFAHAERTWRAHTGGACCALVMGEDGTVLAAWGAATGESWSTRIVRVPVAGDPVVVAQLPSTGEMLAPPVVAGRPQGPWLVAAWDAGGRSNALFGGAAPDEAPQALPVYRFAPVIAAAMAPDGSAALVGSYFTQLQLARRAASTTALGAVERFNGAPAGAGFAGGRPVVLALTWSWHEDRLSLVRPD